ncbi:glycerate kinase type-2 family protein [Kerstersia gyiorum]|jgi:hydroxypyruvate reductase|uniref:glycerate kinase type-2 family protein n=1 Tax=Kerstersia gyiorum TaxID=206506 RepID=UPI002430D17F|nr:glycerate kinase [Kerstersia gyiorum]MCH4270646.1 glycerate kinase [Kerstersia gyiorum]MCI1230503.1 glycerate kinase [Kerstersia gyiorum]
MTTRHDPPEFLSEHLPEHLLRRLFDAAVDAADPARCLPPLVARLRACATGGRVVVIGAGKASAAMAAALEQAWDGPLSGLVVTRYGHAVPCRQIEIIEAAHPVPDDAGAAAAQRMLAQVAGLGPDDLVIGLFSGGGSALLAAPLAGISLADKQALSRALLASGASISEINCVRRHLSAIKGGRLAAACHPAQIINLLISDVPGDDPADVASGPTVADASTCEQAQAILQRYGIEPPVPVQHVLASQAAESCKPGDPALPAISTHLVATPRMALLAAAAAAREAGIPAWILGDAIEGEAREVARAMAGIALSCARYGEPFAAPCVLLSGGETTVTLRGQGRGGRNVEFLLALALALRGQAGIHALAADTDGVDGQEPVAGAIITPATLARARTLGLDPAACLADNDGHGFFERLGDGVITGPTLTNVNDFRALLILPGRT